MSERSQSPVPGAAPSAASTYVPRALLDSPLIGERDAMQESVAAAGTGEVLILGVGNVLMGDEGVGVHVLRQLEREPLLPGVRLLDGGTGGINLLMEFDGVRAILLVDATRDGRAAGTITHLQPKRVVDLPRGLGAHDFGLKDLFAAAALLGRLPELHLYTIAVVEVRPMCTELSPAVAAAVLPVTEAVRRHAEQLAVAYAYSQHAASSAANTCAHVANGCAAAVTII